MEVFAEYLTGIEHAHRRTRMRDVLYWVTDTFPALIGSIAWNQPVFTDHGTFIIGFSAAKHHMAVAPERAAIIHFSDEIAASGYEHSKELIRIKWESPVDFSLLSRIIEFNCIEKKDCATYWRKPNM